MALERRTELRRGELSPISAKRLAEFGGVRPASTLDKPGGRRGTGLARGVSAIGPTPEDVEAVVDREQHSCVVCGRFLEPYGRGSSWSVHHRQRIRTNNRLSNLVAVCGGEDVPGCHQEIHANVAKAELVGWLVRKGFDPATKVMAHSQFGWVLLDDGGGWTAVEAEFIPNVDVPSEGW